MVIGYPLRLGLRLASLRRISIFTPRPGAALANRAGLGTAWASGLAGAVVLLDVLHTGDRRRLVDVDVVHVGLGYRSMPQQIEVRRLVRRSNL